MAEQQAKTSTRTAKATSASTKKTATKKAAKKPATSRKKLVIVESPGKVKNIKKYLGRGYEVVASVGHVRDLPKSQLGVDVENEFTPKYINIRAQSKVIKMLKEEASKCKQVFLATDPDREGEAISWHLAQLLGLDENEENRVTFQEITQNGIQQGMEHPRRLNQNLINAQQTRRILDRLVGYQISPFLWQKIRRGLSAGRVQSAVLKMIVDREGEIRDFVPKEYWSIEATLSSEQSKHPFVAKFYGKNGRKIELATKEETDAVLAQIQGADYRVESVKKGTRKKSPAPPFITSTLQQEAARRLGFQARRTMRAAQELYEGMDVEGFGSLGLITYMRTDSLRISEEARQAAKDYILQHYPSEYYPEKPRYFKSKASAQDGHEAIRPSTPAITPAMAKSSLTADQYKIYKLIWERFIASQMANCVLNTVQTSIDAGGYTFRASGFSVAFDGYTVLYEEGKDEETLQEGMLPDLKEQEILKLHKVQGNQHFTQPPARYTEASLTKAMEETGIGRPSTYATIITTVLTREYVEREGKQLKPTTLGEVVTKLLAENFDQIVDTRFTAHMEEELDDVEYGNKDWKQALQDFYGDFSKALELAHKNNDGSRIQLPDEVTDEVCDLCGKPMVVKVGRFGKFLACSGYPDCKNTKAIVKKTGGFCPRCSKEMVEKKSKKGKKFYGCSGYPNCDFVTWDLPVAKTCPDCGKTMFQRGSKKDQLYCANEACSGYKKQQESKSE